MKSSIEISQNATLKNICEIASTLGLGENDYESYGKYKAKLSLSLLNKTSQKENGKLIVVTAMSPTSSGEGKTTQTIGLSMALHKLGKKSIACLREPSLGPTFGIKGGAAGGGYSQVLPMEDINLHFTGDIHAISSANNLLSAILDNHIYRGNELDIDPNKITWKRAIDMNDRILRSITIGENIKSDFYPLNGGFEITAASEIMAILCVSKNLHDLKKKLGKIIVGFTEDDQPVTAHDLKAAGAMAVILKDAIKPNLVQTIENTPSIIHGGPFANVAHGCPSLIGINLAMKLADFVTIEPGFGSDLGAEKFFNILCTMGNLKPNMTVLVITCKAIKQHGGVSKKNLNIKNLEAVKKGFVNVEKHVENLKLFGIPLVIAINKFGNDHLEELNLVKNLCMKTGVSSSISDVFSKGGDGGLELAKNILEILNQPQTSFRSLYDDSSTIKEKINLISNKIYGAKNVFYTEKAEESIQMIKDLSYDRLPICIAKTPFSFSDDKNLIGRPKDFTITIKNLKISAGAGFIVVYAGNIMTMPGLSKNPAAEIIDIDDKGKTIGLF